MKPFFFLLFIVSAIGFKLISAWMPIDIFLALALWTGILCRSEERIRARIFYLLGLMIAIICSDLVFAYVYSRPFIYPGMFFNELAILSVWGIGFWAPKRLTNMHLGFWGSSSAVLTFFILSNLVVFLFSGMYPQTTQGLLACYLAAIPFVKMQWLSNTLAIAGINVFAKIRVKVPVQNTH